MTGSGLALTADAARVLASSGGDSGDGSGLVFLLLLAGPIFYAQVYLRYRNTDKRHHHESETRSQMLDVQADDTRTGARTGLTNARMKGANSRKVRAP